MPSAIAASRLDIELPYSFYIELREFQYSGRVLLYAPPWYASHGMSPMIFVSWQASHGMHPFFICIKRNYTPNYTHKDNPLVVAGWANTCNSFILVYTILVMLYSEPGTVGRGFPLSPLLSKKSAAEDLREVYRQLMWIWRRIENIN